MAINQPIPVSSDVVFPFGAYVTTEVSKVPVFKDGRRTDEQMVDEVTKFPMWEVTVMDADPSVKGPAKSVKVQLICKVQPTPPPELPGTPFRPVEFEGLTARPWIQTSGSGDRMRANLMYSFKATGMTAPRTLAQVKASVKAPISTAA